MSDVRVLGEQGRKIVGNLNRHIQTAGPYARLKRVPKSYANGLKDRHPFLIGQRRACAEQIAHDVPECIPRMGVILAGSQ
jgi:hypothetical protein